MGSIVKIHNVDKQSTRLAINGRVVVVPHNTDFPLSDAYVDALRNSHVNFSILGEMADCECAGDFFGTAGEGGPGGSPSPVESPQAQVPGADSLDHHHAPADCPIVKDGIAAALDAEKQVAGADSLSHNGTPGSKADDADGDDGEDDKSDEPDALDQSVAKLAKYLDGVTDVEEIDRLIAGEIGGRSRVGALDALKARKEALTPPTE